MLKTPVGVVAVPSRGLGSDVTRTTKTQGNRQTSYCHHVAITLLSEVMRNNDGLLFAVRGHANRAARSEFWFPPILRLSAVSSIVAISAYLRISGYIDFPKSSTPFHDVLPLTVD